jgi:hypothetical protein
LFRVIGDVGLTHLAGLTALESLSLDGTDVSDASIPLLARLHRLRYLNVQSTGVTRAGVERLHESLPACEIHSGTFWERFVPVDNGDIVEELKKMHSPGTGLF